MVLPDISSLNTESPNPSETDLHQEIEYTFLLSEIPEFLDLSKYPYIDITQGYLEATDDYEVRVREKIGIDKTKYVMTEKTGSGKVRGEKEWQISKEEFDEKIKNTIGLPIIKRRYLIDDIVPDSVIELDIFSGHLAGLILAEIEVEDGDSHLWVPEWLQVDVTDNVNYSNKNLSLYGLPTDR